MRMRSSEDFSSLSTFNKSLQFIAEVCAFHRTFCLHPMMKTHN
ncbi:hypothetical protein NMG60_11030046 [Bertholletia excelsa]